MKWKGLATMPRTKINLMPKPVPNAPIIEDTKPDGFVRCSCGHHWIDPNREMQLQHTEWEELRKDDDQ